jgi:hypothetical protein
VTVNDELRIMKLVIFNCLVSVLCDMPNVTMDHCWYLDLIVENLAKDT